MKKKVIFGAFFVAIAMLGAVVGGKSLVSNSTDNNLLMENVEALSDGEGGGGTGCSGYRKWKTSGFLQTEHQFYDCQCVLRTGYGPKGSCY